MKDYIVAITGIKGQPGGVSVNTAQIKVDDAQSSYEAVGKAVIEYIQRDTGNGIISISAMEQNTKILWDQEGNHDRENS